MTVNLLSKLRKQRSEKISGITTSIAVLIIIVIALAGLGLVVINSLSESSWGTFTIATTIPIAIIMGLWMFKIRKGKTVEATIFGVAVLSACVILGRYVPGSQFASWFTYDHKTLTILLAGYGFFASVLTCLAPPVSERLPEFDNENFSNCSSCGGNYCCSTYT